jgi:hypothetical protein
VDQLRRLAMTHRHLLALMLVLTLLARVLIPAGYMPTFAGKTLTIAMCTSAGPVTMTLPVSGDGHGESSQKGSLDQPCIFSALGCQGLAATCPMLLAAALLFAFMLAFAAIRIPPLSQAHYLRPPLRGPPLSV